MGSASQGPSKPVSGPSLAATFPINNRGVITGSEIEYDKSQQLFYLIVTDGTKNYYGDLENGRYIIQKINNKSIPEDIKKKPDPLDELKKEIMTINKSSIDFELSFLQSAPPAEKVITFDNKLIDTALKYNRIELFNGNGNFVKVKHNSKYAHLKGENYRTASCCHYLDHHEFTLESHSRMASVSRYKKQ